MHEVRLVTALRVVRVEGPARRELYDAVQEIVLQHCKSHSGIVGALNELRQLFNVSPEE